ncbi:MAG: tetratricopeptide repeat protein [Bacteroidetes bacterium]|nr:tetratricopeptide repeat protein [Bacteroidota bacterium]
MKSTPRMIRIGTLFILLVLLMNPAHAQNIDSLEVLAKTSTDIDKRMDAIQALSVYYLRSDTVQSKAWCAEGMRVAKEANNIRGIIVANENYARYYTEQGRYDSAIFVLQNSLSQYDLPEYNLEIGASYVSLGNIYDIQSNYEKALECYLLAEKKYEAEDYTYGLGITQMGIGNIYSTTGFYQDSKVYFRKSYKNLLPHNEVYASWSMNNMASAMTELGEYDSAVAFFEKSLAIKLRNGDIYGASYTYNDLGSLYFRQEMYDKALSYYLKALESKEGLEGISKETLSNTFLNIAKIYARQKNYLSAVFYGEQGLENAKASASLNYQSEAYKLLGEVNYKSGNYKTSYEMLNQFVQINDSLDKLVYNDKLAEMQSKYDADQKQKEIELLNASNKVSQLETERAKKETQTVTFYLAGAVVILLLVAFLGIALYRSNAVKNKANEMLQKKNEEINHQKELVEEKNKEITDSINYAKRIQNAILPPQRLVEKVLPDAFILYRPKDIVAGDFYWLESFAKASDSDESPFANRVPPIASAVAQASDSDENSFANRVPPIASAVAQASDSKGAGFVPPVTSTVVHTPDSESSSVEGSYFKDGNHILLAAADCTGHGVPGALVSVVCHNALNRSVREYGITDPGKILDKTREIVIREFEKSDDEVKDGMDISLLSLTRLKDTSYPGYQLLWSGANNPLWILRKGATEIEEIRPDKQPVGKFAGAMPFTTQSLHVAPGDTLYIFTDGYQDQFGGEKGKKFKASNLKQLILSVSAQTMAEQRRLIDARFVEWKGNLEQVDDICIIGIRL